MRRERYLVIGGSGLVGSHIVHTLRENSRDVRATHRRDAPASDEILDITDANAVHRAVIDAAPTVVVLAAAEPHVERCEREPEATRLVNVEGSRAVAAAAREIGATVVVFSSEYVFDGVLGDYGEDDAPAPLNEYGRQKVEVERIARDAGPHLVCRTSGIFGHESRRKNFVLQLVDALGAGQPFTVPSDQTITPTDAKSLSRAVVELIERGYRGTFHVAGPECLARADFARRIAGAFRLDPTGIRPTPTADLGLKARRPLRAGLRGDKLRAALGHGLVPVDDALRELAMDVGG